LSLDPVGEFTLRKGKLPVLILGPYKPLRARATLHTLKKCLVKAGYAETRLVEDFPDIVKYHEDPDIHFTLKSQSFMKHWAKALIFVLLKNGRNDGAISELGFAAQNLRSQFSSLAVFSDFRLSTQVRGPIKIHSLRYEKFSDSKELCEYSTAACGDFVYDNYWDI
jgi:hypothetical protein